MKNHTESNPPQSASTDSSLDLQKDYASNIKSVTCETITFSPRDFPDARPGCSNLNESINLIIVLLVVTVIGSYMEINKMVFPIKCIFLLFC